MANSILVHPLPPLELVHAHRTIARIRTHRSSSEPHPDPLQWTISNKYYNAQVTFSLPPLAANDAEGDEPAVLLLVPGTASPPKELGEPLARLAGRKPEYEVALLVTLPVPSPDDEAEEDESPLDEEAWEDLALSHGFEWVHLPSVSPADDSDPDRTPDDEGGISRVVSALHAVMWESMVPVASPQRSVRTEEEDDDDEGEEDEDEGSMGVPPLPSPRPFVPVQLAFPDTFLPSIPRSSPRPPAVTTPSSDPASQRFDDAFSSTDAPHPDPNPDPSFEDDFAPFIGAPPASSSLHFEAAFAAELPSPPPPLPLYRHPELAFPDSHHEGFVPLSDWHSPSDPRSRPAAHSDSDSLSDDDDDDDDLDEGAIAEQDLDALFDRLRAIKDEASDPELGLEERRRLAERAVRELGLA